MQRWRWLGWWHLAVSPKPDEHFTSIFPGLLIILDDGGASAAESQCRDVRFTEGTAPPPSPTGGEDEVAYAQNEH